MNTWMEATIKQIGNMANSAFQIDKAILRNMYPSGLTPWKAASIYVTQYA